MLKKLPDLKILVKMVEVNGLKNTASILGCHQSTIRKYLKEFGLYSDLRSTSSPKLTKDELYELYFEKEMSFNDIKEKVGCTTHHLQSSFKKYGWKARSRKKTAIKKNRKHPEGIVIDAYKKYNSTVAAGLHLGMTPEGVACVLRKHSIPRDGNNHKAGGEIILTEWLREFGITDFIERWDDWDKEKILNRRWNHIDLYLPSQKAFIEFHGLTYHFDKEERDARKKKDFLKAYPDHTWHVIWDVHAFKKNIYPLLKEVLKRRLLNLPKLKVGDFSFREAPKITQSQKFLGHFHPLKGATFVDRGFEVTFKGVVVGVALFGPPQNAQEYDLEFKRLAFVPHIPKNLPSKFISWCMKQLPKDLEVVTYIDDEHQGSSFLGSNWMIVGTTQKKNSYVYKKGDEVLSRRKAYLLSKREGKKRSVWVKENGFFKELVPPKKVLVFFT